METVLGGLVVDGLLAQLGLKGAETPIDILVHLQRLLVSIGIGVPQGNLGVLGRDLLHQAHFPLGDGVTVAAAGDRTTTPHEVRQHHGGEHIAAASGSAVVKHTAQSGQAAQRVDNAQRQSGNAGAQAGASHALAGVFLADVHKLSSL